MTVCLSYELEILRNLREREREGERGGGGVGGDREIERQREGEYNLLPYNVDGHICQVYMRSD